MANQKHELHIAQEYMHPLLKKLLRKLRFDARPVRMYVQVTDARTGASWMYDEWHDVLENGDYVLTFMDKYHAQRGTWSIRLDESMEATLHLVFRYQSRGGRLTARFLNDEEFNARAKKKSLYKVRILNSSN